MNFVTPRGLAEIDEAEAPEGNIHELVQAVSAVRQNDSDSEKATDNLGSLLSRVSGTSIREIDNLINELRISRRRMRSDSRRVQHDIEQYATLSQSVMQLTKIIAESMTQMQPDSAKDSGSALDPSGVGATTNEQPNPPAK